MNLFNKYYLYTFFILAVFFAVSCQKNGEAKRIKKSILFIEDNVNGRVPPPDNVIEATNFFYNENGTLNKATVYSDTTARATLLKEINVSYHDGYVLVNSYLDSIGDITYKVTYNDKKQVTSIAKLDSSGLYISYFNDRISSIKILPIGAEYVNFMYDANNNLLQYELIDNNELIIRANLEYTNDVVTSEFDSRFFTKEIKFMYIGGLDLFTKLGLNAGLSSHNKLIKRTDIKPTNGQVYETYHYGYTHNSQSLIMKRNVRFSTDTLYYQFKY